MSKCAHVQMPHYLLHPSASKKQVKTGISNNHSPPCHGNPSADGGPSLRKVSNYAHRLPASVMATSFLLAMTISKKQVKTGIFLISDFSFYSDVGVPTDICKGR
jgi:hypothetical protein